VESDPAGATVFLGADEYGVTPVEIRGLAPGASLLTLVLEDHRAGTETVELFPGEFREVAVRLERSTGQVAIHALPDSYIEFGHETYQVGDEGVVEVPAVEVGSYPVTVTLDEHSPSKARVVVRTGETSELLVEQAVAPARLVLAGKPADAVATVDGRTIATFTGPGFALDGAEGIGEIALGPGEHIVEIQARLHKPFHRVVELEPGQILRVEYVLEPIDAGLDIIVEPIGATVVVAGASYETTGVLELRDLVAGDHRVRVSHDDYYPRDAVVYLSGGDVEIEEFHLEPKPGRVLVISEPLGAEVWIGDDLLGLTPFSGAVPAGETTIAVKKSGFANATREMDILPNRDHRVNVVLGEE
jgi:hypothetical protein